LEHSVWSTASYHAETFTLGEVDQEYLEGFEIWCCRKVEISFTDWRIITYRQGRKEHSR